MLILIICCDRYLGNKKVKPPLLEKEILLLEKEIEKLLNRFCI